MSRRLYDAEISEALRRHIWNQLKTSLSLVSCNSGSQFNLQGPEPITSYLPAVRVMFEGFDGDRDRSRSILVGRYRFSIHYLRALADGEDVEGTTRDKTGDIGALFMTETDWTIPTWTTPQGALFRSATTIGMSVQEETDEQQLEIGLGHGVVTVEVECDSHPY